MSENFSWQTDEEDGWDEPLPANEPAPAKRPWRTGRWWLILPLLLVAGLVGAVTYRQYQQRLAAVERDVVADLLAGVETVERAVKSGDVELFRLNLSGRDPEWTAAQTALMAEQLLLQRDAFGLRWTGEIALPAAEAVTLTPDLQGGEVPLEAAYETTDETGRSITVRLRHDHVFRQADDRRWLLAPPLEPYWGTWQSVDLGPLRLFVSERDADLVRRMAADLAPAVDRLCADVGGCESLQIRLERNPRTLLSLAGDAWILTAADRPSRAAIPTPTLVGLPLDDAGYDALLRGYRRHLLGALYARELNVRCCRNGLLLQARIDHRLTRLGLNPWPVAPEQYGALLTRWREPDDMEALFDAPADAAFRGEQWPAAYALVEYGLSNYPESARIGLEEKLPNLATFAGLLRHLMPLDDRERPRAWATFLARRQGDGVPTWPAGYDLTLACRSQSSFFDVQLYHFAPGAAPQPAGTVEGPATLFDVAGLDGYLVQRVLTGEEDQIPQVAYWFQGRESSVAPEQPEQILAMGRDSWIQTVERFVPLWQMAPIGSGTPGAGFALLDVASCQSGECAVTPLPGFPDVAPGGRHVLTIDFAGNREESLGLSTTAAPADIQWLPRSRWAFWIDAERFASINWDGTVQVATVDAPAARRTLITAADIVAALPEAIRPPSGRAEISDGFANPADPDQIYLFVAPDRGLSSRSTLLLVRYDVADDTVAFMDAPQRTSLFPHFSPDGRWLVLWSEAQGRGRFREESKLTIIDTASPDAPPVELAGDTTVNVQWLPEGQQLLVNHGRFARLYAPDSGRTALFTLPDGLRCQQTFWRNGPAE